MSEQLRKFSVGELVTVVRTAYTAGQNIVGSSALVVDIRRHSVEGLDLLAHRIEQYTVLIDDELYNLYESELQ